MPRTPEQELVRRALATRRRESALEELLPLLQDKVVFPEWLIDLVWEQGLDDLRLKQIWNPRGNSRPKSVSASSSSSSPKPKKKVSQPLEQMQHPSAHDVLRVVSEHQEGMTTRALTEKFRVSKTTIAKRLRILMSEGMVYRFGASNDPKYEISDLGMARLRKN